MVQMTCWQCGETDEQCDCVHSYTTHYTVPKSDTSFDLAGLFVGTTKSVKITDLEEVVHTWINNDPKSSHSCAADIMNLIGGVTDGTE